MMLLPLLLSSRSLLEWALDSVYNKDVSEERYPNIYLSMETLDLVFDTRLNTLQF